MFSVRVDKASTDPANRKSTCPLGYRCKPVVLLLLLLLMINSFFKLDPMPVLVLVLAIKTTG
jgi:hypothetical protein